MDWLEQELRQALERKAPSPDLAARVAAAAAREAAAAPRPIRMLPRWLPVAAAVLLIAGGAVYHRHQGRVAKDRVMLAMRITAGQLNHIQARVKEAKP